jgi:hypothetical protein
MPTAATTVTPAPMPTDKRVLALARQLKVSRREALGATTEAWAWMVAEHRDGVVVGVGVDDIDTVVDLVGYGQAMAAAGLVVAGNNGIALPPELRRAAGRLDDSKPDQDAPIRDREKELARNRKRRQRKRQRLEDPASGSQPRRTAAGSEPASNPRRKPRVLGTACGLTVMLLDGQYGLYVELVNAQPKVTATAAAHDYDALTLADALELLLPRHEKNKPSNPRQSRVPRLADLEAEAKAARQRQAAAAAVASRRDEANNAFTEAASGAEDQDVDCGAVRDGHAAVTHVTRDAVTCHADGHAGPPAGTSASGSPAMQLAADPRHAGGHADCPVGALSSTSSSLDSLDAQRRTTTTEGGHAAVTAANAAWTRGGTMQEHDDGRPLQEWELKDMLAKRERWADRCAAALGIDKDAVIRLAKSDKHQLRKQLEAAGIDPNTGLPAADGLQLARLPDHRRGRSRLEAAGIPVPTFEQDKPAAPADIEDQEDQEARRAS